MTFKLFSFTEAPIHRFFAEVTKIRESKGPFVYTASHSYWSPAGRPKNVMPPLGEGANLFIDGVGRFLERKEEYKRKGVAYKIGFNLTGEPGTGKSSIVAYTANKYGLHVYLLNSESIAKFDDLREDIKKNSIILIEDIDMTVAGNRRGKILGEDEDPEERRDTDASNKVVTQETIRDFLNALDGICEFSDAIIVSTTNKPDALDPALIRPGRLDSSIEIGKYTHKEQIQHINRFYDVELNPDEWTHLQDRTVAELQFICTANMDDVDAALKSL